MNRYLKLLFFNATLLSCFYGYKNDLHCANAETTFLGRHEAESFSNNIISNNPWASNKKGVDLGDSGKISYTFNLDESGQYDIVVGYYTGSAGAKLRLIVNDINYDETIYHPNGWLKDTERIALAKRFTVDFFEGENTIEIASYNSGKNKYLNLDFFDINEVGKNILGVEDIDSFVADGMRIQGEYACDYVGNYCNKTIKMHNGGDGSDGLTIASEDYDGCPAYRVYVPETGAYNLQIAYYSSNATSSKYTFFAKNENDNSIVSNAIDFPVAPNNWNTNFYSSKVNSIMNLKAGYNIIYFNRNANYSDIDWFRLFKLITPSLGDKIEAEDVGYGDFNAKKHQDQYPILSNYAVELAQGYLSFKINIEEAGKYRLYLAAYTETREAYLKIKINLGDTICYTVGDKANGWLNASSSLNMIDFEIELESGENTINIYKGDDDIQFNYVDIDYIKIYKDVFLVDEIVLEAEEVRPLSEIYDFDNIIKAASLNNRVVKIEDDSLVAVGAGEAIIRFTYTVDGVDLRKDIRVIIEKKDYQNVDDIKAFDTVKHFNNRVQYVDVVCPKGWTNIQTGNGSQIGEYDVTITFTHPFYNDIVKHAKLVIDSVRIDYIGDDFFFDDQIIEYDGQFHALTASFPLGWSVKYDCDNSFSEIGTYEVTATFVNDDQIYNDIVKKATLTITPKKEDESKKRTSRIITTILVSTFSLAGATTIGVILFRYFKKKNNLKPE